MNDDRPSYVVGHAAVYPTVLLGRPVIVRKPTLRRKRLKKRTRCKR